jgi:hypothetical protein
MFWIALMSVVSMTIGVVWRPLGADLSPVVMVIGGAWVAAWAVGHACTDWRVRRSRHIERQVDRQYGRV